jgi:hypothetical protein
MGEPETKYWFRAKRYGWGWGLPITWQGWVFFCVWLAAIVGGAVGLRRSLPTHLGPYFLFIAVMIGIMAIVCHAKGEPLRWRWGDRDKPPGA